jgi:hypothetical protein
VFESWPEHRLLCLRLPVVYAGTFWDNTSNGPVPETSVVYAGTFWGSTSNGPVPETSVVYAGTFWDSTSNDPVPETFRGLCRHILGQYLE